VRRSTALRGISALAVVLLAASACSSSRRGASPATTTAPATTTPGASSTTAASGTTFGDLASPCGKGDAKGATDQGVTDTSIRIAYGDDRGYAASPGLDQEIGDAIKGMVKWCNDQGGILGRQLQGDFYDAAITQVNSVMQQACKADFMLVGEGWALDEAAEGTRVGCNLVAVPTYTVGPDFANAPMMYQGVPNPVDYVPASDYYEVAQLFPEDITKTDVLHTTLVSATEVSYSKDLQAMAGAGWANANCGVTINYQGEPDYKPFAQKYVSCGAKLLFINLSTGPPLEGTITAIDQLGLKPQYLFESNVYSQAFGQWNASTNGIADNSLFRLAFQPLENTQVKAVQDYLDVVHATGGKVGLLGEQAVSSFLLWATAAKSCGSTLTRQCMINALAKVHTWTGGGINAPTDPGANLPASCGILVKLVGSTYSQFYPRTAGQFDCNDKYRFKVSQSAWGTTLGADRIATKFLGPNVIKPQA